MDSRRLTFVARETHDKTRAFPQLDGLAVGELGGFTDRLLIVSALDYRRRRGDVTVGRGDVDAIVRHWRVLSFQECKLLSHSGTAVGRVPDARPNPAVVISNPAMRGQAGH